MSLFVDSDHITLADLTDLDSEVEAIADAQEISVTRIASQAWDDCADEMLAANQAFQCPTVLSNPTRLYVTGGNRSRVDLTQIVATYDGRTTPPFRTWLICQAMVGFYRNAARRMAQSGDRYRDKMDMATDELKTARRRLWQSGLPVVFSPIPCPGAVHVYEAGDWSAANNLQQVNGSTVSPTSIDVAITWITAAGVESGPSSTLTTTVATSKQLRVSTAGLTAPSGVTTWNVYAAVSGSRLRKQTSLAIGTTTYDIAATPSTTGTLIPFGQSPDVFYPIQPTLMRA